MAYSAPMQKTLTWAGRLAWLVVFGVAFAGAIDPHHDASTSAMPGDVVEHVVYGYLLTILTILALPRVNPWLVGGIYLALGAGFEVMQIFGLVSGTFQPKDLASNVAGVAAALIPMALARRKAR